MIPPATLTRMRRVRVASLCTGYGGLELALAECGVPFDLQWYAENDESMSTVLAKHRAGVPNLGDITQLTIYPAPVDLLLAGFPCQTVSVAGKRKGDTDARWLWPDVYRAVIGLKPEQIFIENVRNLVSFEGGRLWRGILDDLTTAGYSVRWMFLGACHVGAAHHRHRVFVVATQSDNPTVTRVHPWAPCGNPRPRGARLLPTVTARDGDGRGTGDAAYWTARRATGRDEGLPLDATVALLPTPRATDGVNGGPNQRGSSGDLALPSAVIAERFGQYATAVAGHARVYGNPPEPTEPNKNGAPRLASTFAEWLMCLPRGHVTDILERVPALKAIGNGVVPAQAAYAWSLLNRQ